MQAPRACWPISDRVGRARPPPPPLGACGNKGTEAASVSSSWTTTSLSGNGRTNREIGRELHVAEKTVKNYVSQILAHLGRETRT